MDEKASKEEPVTTFIRTIADFGSAVSQSVRAAKAYEAADSEAARRVVLDRFVRESGHRNLRRGDHSLAA
jgi:hypothetical protein